MIEFTWNTDDPELDKAIVEEWVKGNSGEFIQLVCGGDQMLLGTVTFAQKKAFAIRKLTEQNLQSVRESAIARVVQVERQRAAQEANEMIGELPELIIHPGALPKPTGKEMVTRAVAAKAKRK